MVHQPSPHFTVRGAPPFAQSIVRGVHVKEGLNRLYCSQLGNTYTNGDYDMSRTQKNQVSMNNERATYCWDDELLPEWLHWEGGGWYASKQVGAHSSQRIVTYRVGDASDNHDEVSKACRRSGLGTPQLLDEPYGIIQ